MMSERGFTPEEAKRPSGKRKKSESPKKAPEAKPAADEYMEVADEDIVEVVDHSQEDEDVVTSAPKLKDMGLKAESKASKSFGEHLEDRREMEKQLDEYSKRRDREGKEKTPEDLSKESKDALDRLELASIHRDSEDLQREKQQAKEKAEMYAETVGAANTLEALKNVVDMIGSVETSSGEKVTSKELKGWIDMAIQFPDSVALERITRNYGLRDKVMELARSAAKEQRGKKMEARVNAAMEAEEVDAGWDQIAADQKRSREEAMEKRVNASLAEDELEDAFMKRGKVIDKLHAAGQSTEKNTMREGIGEMNAKEFEESEKALAQMPALDQQLSRAEKALMDRGITDVDEAMAKRATGGFFGKAKGFLGGLFDKKTRELNSLMDTYASILEARDAAQEKILKRQQLSDRAKGIRRVQNESRPR